MLIDITDDTGYRVDWNLAKQVIHEMKGIPVAVGTINSPAATAHAHDPAAEQNAIRLRLETQLTNSTP